MKDEQDEEEKKKEKESKPETDGKYYIVLLFQGYTRRQNCKRVLRDNSSSVTWKRGQGVTALIPN